MQKKTNVTNLNEGKKAPGRNGSWPETDFSIKVKKRLIDKRMTQKQLAVSLCYLGCPGVTSGYVSQTIYGKKNDEALRNRIREILDIKESRRRKAG